MSIRLEASDWTHEDEQIAFDQIMRRGRWGQVLRTYGLMTDSRDADLMLSFVRAHEAAWWQMFEPRNTLLATIGISYPEVETWS